MKPALKCPTCDSKLVESGGTTFCSKCTTSANEVQLREGDSGRSPEISSPQFKPWAFGDYIIEDQIGEGGSGRVYRALNKRLGRKEALKIIVDQDAWERFDREAKTLASLENEGIVKIHETGSHDGIHYISMELVQGENLAKKCECEPMEPTKAAHLLHQVALAVSYAHNKNVIHRDLKPSNILVDKNSKPKVVDFGLAKRLDALTGDSLTLKVAVLGTAGYMSPEQARGESKLADQRTDIFGLGATLYFILTRKPPFTGESSEEIRKKTIEQEALSLRTHNRSIPSGLELICLKCLEKRPEDRYQSALELAKDLESFLKGKLTIAKGDHWRRKIGGWKRRYKQTVIALAFIIGIVLGAFVVSYYLQLRNTKLQLWETQLEQARAERLLGNVQRARNLVIQASLFRKDFRLQNEAIQLAFTPGACQFQILPFGSVFMASFSPDSALLALGGAVDPRVEAVLPPNGLSEDPVEPAVAISLGKTTERASIRLLLWDVAAGKLISHTGWSHLSPFVFSPNGFWLAVPAPGQRIRLWNLPNRAWSMTLPGSGKPLFSPDSKELAIANTNGYVIYNLPSGTILAQGDNGNVIGFPTHDELLISDANGLRLREIHSGYEHFSSNTPAGDLLALSGDSLCAATISKCATNDGFVITVNSILDAITNKLSFYIQQKPHITTLSRKGDFLLWGTSKEPNKLQVYMVSAFPFGIGTQPMKRFLNVEAGDGVLAEYIHTFDVFQQKQFMGQRIYSAVSSGASLLAATIVPLPSPVILADTLPTRSASFSSREGIAASLVMAKYVPLANSPMNINPLVDYDRSTTMFFLDAGDTVKLKRHEYVALSDDGRLLATQTDGRTHTLNTSTGEKRLDVYGINSLVMLHNIKRPASQYSINGPVDKLQISPSGSHLASSRFIGPISTYDGFSRLDYLVEIKKYQFGFGSNQTMWRAVGPLGTKDKSLYIGIFPISSDNALLERNVNVRTRISGLRVNPTCDYAIFYDWDKDEHQRPITDYYYAPNVMVACHLYDLKQGRDTILFEEPFDSRLFMAEYPGAFSADGKLIALERYLGGELYQMDIWSVANKNIMINRDRIVNTNFCAQNIVFCSNGKHLAVRRDTQKTDFMITVYEVATGRIMATCQPVLLPTKSSNATGDLEIKSGKDYNPLAVSPDGSMIASAQGSRIWFWDLASGKPLACWDAHNEDVSAITFSADGTTLITGSVAGKIKFWDIPYLRRELSGLSLDWQ